MTRWGLIAAVLLLCATCLAEAGQQGRAADPPVKHTCSATDRQFVDVAALNVQSVTLFGHDYLNGAAKAADVIGAANDGASAVLATEPIDPSLVVVRRYLKAMFVEYARAVRAREHGGNATNDMYRAYDLDEDVHDVLDPARDRLAKLGCNVADLL